MSSSDSMPPTSVTSWALDEFEMPHVFEALPSRNVTIRADESAGPNAPVQDLERVEATAYAHGRADGEQLMRAEFAPRVEHAASALYSALEDVRVHQARWIANAEENLAVLAVAVARQLIAREVEADASIVSTLVQNALAQFPLDQAVTIRLHPDDVDSCNALLQATEGTRYPEIRWLPDLHVHRGGCLVEGRERIIDGRVDTALERIYRAIGNVQTS